MILQHILPIFYNTVTYHFYLLLSYRFFCNVHRQVAYGNRVSSLMMVLVRRIM
jgi:hypothetical protein